MEKYRKILYHSHIKVKPSLEQVVCRGIRFEKKKFFTSTSSHDQLTVLFCGMCPPAALRRDVNPTPTMTTVAITTPAAIKNIVETAEADRRFTTLVAVMKAAELK